MSKRPRIFVSRRLPEAVETRLQASYSVELNTIDTPCSQNELVAAMCNYDGLVTTVSDDISDVVLGTPQRSAEIIANVGVGVSNIDLCAAREHKITVSNTPDVLTDATADIAMWLILAATRGTTVAERRLRRGDWHGFSLTNGLGFGLQGKVLGIIGMGRIGRATARRAALGFGMRIHYFNRSAIDELEFPAVAANSIDEVMEAADIVSIHVPGGKTPVVTSDHIQKLRPHTFLVNTARGDSLDQDALVDALIQRRIAGAGLDVYVDEPQVPQALLEMDNVTLLPHIGSATMETRTAMGMLAVDNLDAFFAGKVLPTQVP